MKRRDKSQNCWLCQLLVALLGRLVLQKWNSCAALVQVGSQANVEVGENRLDMGGLSELM